MKDQKIYKVVPFLPVKDLKETINFYKEYLGFSNEWFWEETDAGISRDELRLLFNRNPTHAERINSPNQSLEVCWFVDNVDEFYKEYKEKGVQIVSELKNEPWGIREFTIKDINGYWIRVGESY